MDSQPGLEETDLGALTSEQQSKLNTFKIETRIKNEQYLREHPEVDCLMSSFLRKVMREKPENIRDFAADFFTDPELALRVQALTQDKLSKVKHANP